MDSQIKEKLNGKKVVVTGASGYLGTHLCTKLAELGCYVYAVSRNPIERPHIQNLFFESIDLTDLKKVRKYFQFIQPEYVFHLAGQAMGSRTMDLVPSTFQSNLVTTINLLTVVTEQKINKLVITGSLEEPNCDISCSIPSSPYAISKWAASGYAKMFNMLYNTPVVIVRLFMVYGPGNQSDVKLIPYVVNSLLKNNSPKLSSGNRMLDWIYIDDAIDGFISTALANNINGQTVDIGSGELLSIKDLIEEINLIINSEARPLFGSVQDRKKEQIRKANIIKSFSQIAWKPITKIEEGLKKTIKWYQNQN